VLVPSIPPLARHLFPVRGTQTRGQPHPICDPLNEASGAGPEGVVLVAMHHFMRQDALYLVGASRSLDPTNVVQREVDLLVVRVQLTAGRVGDPRHGPQDERDGAGRWRCSRLGGGRLVKQGENALHGARERLTGIDGGEKGPSAIMIEVADFEAEFREREVGHREYTGSLRGI
jgi:hypothetical protein